MTERASHSVRREIDCDLTSAEMLAHFRSDAHPFALIGEWAGGGAIVGSEPTLKRCPPASFDDVFCMPPPGHEETCQPRADGFGGGWVGYLGFGLSNEFHALPPAPGPPRRLPLWWFGFYDHLLRLDPRSGQWFFEALVTAGRSELIERRYAEISARIRGRPQSPPRPYECGEFMVTPSPGRHAEAVARAVEYISCGDIFQANICLRLEADYTGDPIDFFIQGIRQLSPPYAAFLFPGPGAVASFSPELFLRRHGPNVLTKPIKGTCRRSAEPRQAERERAQLQQSIKNRAENIMIVDLMRNDLSRVCEPGTVVVPRLVAAEPHPGVWHLVSDVRGKLADGVTDAELLRATLPPGSITGAPKVRAMEVIHELESVPREVYTGAVGYRSPIAGMEFSVAIRTFEFHDGKVFLGAGGGIVADSDPATEYEECLLKAGPLIAAVAGLAAAGRPRPHPDARRLALAPRPASGVFTSLRVTRGAGPGLDRHLLRLADSARTVFGKPLPGRFHAQLQDCLSAGGSGRLRITVFPAGGTLAATVELLPLDEAPAPVTLHPVEAVALGAHKWADRRMLTHLAATTGPDPGAQVLLIDADGGLLETDRANIFAVVDGILRTPAADGRILPGITRSAVLSEAHSQSLAVAVGRLTIPELRSASEVFVTNSVRGVIPVSGLAPGRVAWPRGPVTEGIAALLQSRLENRLYGQPEKWHRARANGSLASRRAGNRALVVLIDNYDSFTYNLAHMLVPHSTVEVVRNDEVPVAEIAGLRPAGIVISPGPCTPKEAGISVDVVRQLGGTIPILGVCLGHQAIAAAYGAKVVRTAPVHGKTAIIEHDGAGIFRGLPTAFEAARYHSLLVADDALPACLSVTARTGHGLIMAIRHRSHPVNGVQFHPESILTTHGKVLIENFMRSVRAMSLPAR